MRQKTMMLRKNENEKKPLDFGLIGKVKIGMIAPGKNYPTSVDYFIFTPLQVGGNDSYVKVADQLFPNTKEQKRNRLPIIFSSDSPDNIQNYYELRDNTGKMIARTDYRTIEISITPGWEDWYKTNYQKIKTEQKKPGFYTFSLDHEFGEGSVFGDFKAFINTMEEKANLAAFKASNGKLGYPAVKEKENIDEKKLIKWVEILKIRFVIVNFPVLGRWELSTKGSASSIGGLIDAYQAVQHARGSVVGIQWELKVDKVKNGRAGASKTYPVLSLAPVITASDVNSGNLLLNSVNIHQNGLLLSTGEKHNPNPDIVFGEDIDYEE